MWFYRKNIENTVDRIFENLVSFTLKNESKIVIYTRNFKEIYKLSRRYNEGRNLGKFYAHSIY